MKLIPANLDEKNVTTDWIDGIFDNYDRLVGGKDGKIYVGFVKGRPTTCFVDANMVLWSISKFHCGVFNNKSALNDLILRLKAADDDESDLVVKYDTSMEDELVVMQKFFFVEDADK